MSFSSPPPPREPPPPPTRTDKDAVSSGVIANRRLRRKSGIVSTFLGGSAGEPGTIGKVGLTGSRIL